MVKMQNIVAACLISMLALLTPLTGQGNEAFVAGVTDLPLMPGLEEMPKATLVFDKPDGRLVRAAARGESSQSAVWHFYDETLPQLGWRRLGQGHYARDGENLHISVELIDSKLTVHFAIAPRSE